MDTKQLERHLETLRPAAIAAGDHMRRSRCRLVSQLYAAQGAAARRSGFKRMPVILVIGALGAAATAALVLSGTITRSIRWRASSSSPLDFLALDAVEEQYQDELTELWNSGSGVLIAKLEQSNERFSMYRVKFALADGTSRTLTAQAPPDPVKRAELKSLMAAGNGTNIGTIRKAPTDFLQYVNQYVLSDGDPVNLWEQFPPMSDAQRADAQAYIGEQIKAGTGTVVGNSRGFFVVDYRLPDGRIFTSLATTPPAELTPERQAEIHELKRNGQGRLIEQGFALNAAVYMVEYSLSDGTTFRVGQARPVMSDEEWERTRSEAQALYAAGEFIRNTITGSDGLPVDVIEITLSSGYVAVIPTRDAFMELWGLR